MIIRNAIRCNICGGEIESTYRHDYLLRCFEGTGYYTDISIYKSTQEENRP